MIQQHDEMQDVVINCIISISTITKHIQISSLEAQKDHNNSLTRMSPTLCSDEEQLLSDREASEMDCLLCTR